MCFPVPNLEDAIPIARDWIVLHGVLGFVTEFDVRTDS